MSILDPKPDRHERAYRADRSLTSAEREQRQLDAIARWLARVPSSRTQRLEEVRRREGLDTSSRDGALVLLRHAS
jgi:predicted transcriptional regulator